MSRRSDSRSASDHPEPFGSAQGRSCKRSHSLLARTFGRAIPSANLRDASAFVRFLAPLVTTVLIFFFGPSLLYAQERSAAGISHEVKEIFERASKAVVKIHGLDQHSPICGTGFFIDPTGTLYTAYTVGGEAEDFTIEFNGKKYPARQLVKDPRSGIAMLKIDAATPALTVGKSEEMEVATPVVAIGYPLDLPETPNFGLIAGLDRKYLGQYFSTIHLRANLPTQRGEAGSPLMNMKGEVVGIVV